eukprot:10029238-Lingulodinium_polyedra.AAC.1
MALTRHSRFRNATITWHSQGKITARRRRATWRVNSTRAVRTRRARSTRLYTRRACKTGP